MAISGALLKKARTRRAMSQREVGRLLGKSQNYVSKLENDFIVGGIKGDELLTLAAELEYDPEVFMGIRSLEDGDLRVNPRRLNLSDLVRTIEEVRALLPTESEDQIAQRIRADRELRRVFELLAFRDGSIKHRAIERLTGWIEGYEERATACDR